MPKRGAFITRFYGKMNTGMTAMLLAMFLHESSGNASSIAVATYNKLQSLFNFSSVRRPGNTRTKPLSESLASGKS